MIEAHLERAVLSADLAGLQELDDEQWQELGDLAVTEGLEGLLYHRCASEGVEVPAEVYYTWRTGYWVWATDNFAALQALKSVLAELVRQGVEAIVLPGVPLLAFYPDPGCRPKDDIAAQRIADTGDLSRSLYYGRWSAGRYRRSGRDGHDPGLYRPLPGTAGKPVVVEGEEAEQDEE